MTGLYPFEQPIDINQVWNATYDNMPINEILNELQLNHVLWECYAFHDMIFGPNGVYANIQVQVSASLQVSSGFLQSAFPEEDLNDVTNEYKDVHNRIVLYANALIDDALDD